MQGRRSRRTHRLSSAGSNFYDQCSHRPAFEPLEERRLLAGVPELLKDINATTAGSDPNYIGVIDDAMYFTIAAGELWKSDGSTAGTQFVQNVSLADQFRTNSVGVELNDRLYFFTLDFSSLETRVSRLWETDGTAAGTVEVLSFPFSENAVPLELTATSDALYFLSSDGVLGRELWTSDGTAGGTRMVKDIAPGPASSTIGPLIAMGDKVYLAADDGVHGERLWRSDGTEVGTRLVADNLPGASGTNPLYLTNVDGKLLFVANSESGSERLIWTSDGTAAGTHAVTPIAVNESTGAPFGFDGNLYFAGDSDGPGTGLWKTDGTAEGTMLVKDIVSGSSSPPRFFAEHDGLIYFQAAGDQLWRTDGTEQGTEFVVDGYQGNDWRNPQSLPVPWGGAGGKMLFLADDGVHGRELWRVDESGVSLVKDVQRNAPTWERFWAFPAELNGIRFFAVNDGTHGKELWRTDGTESGTRLIKDINTEAVAAGSDPSHFTEVNGVTFFVASENIHGAELWKTDGTTSGTVLVKDISPGLNGTEFVALHNVNGTLWFLRVNYDGEVGHDDDEGSELWSSDGTDAGTKLIAKLPYFDGGRDFGESLAIGDTLFFNFDYYYDEYQVPPGEELWKSDGTQEGTKLVKDIRAGELGSRPANFVELNGKLYFTADDGTGVDLWSSDGTESGTVLVKQLASEAGPSRVYEMTVVGGRLYFVLNDNDRHPSIWASDGTTAGTQPLFQRETTSSLFDELKFHSFGDRAIFRAWDENNISAIVISDGRPEGTVPLHYGWGNGYIEVNGSLFFGAGGVQNDGELWVTDGTLEGTRLAFKLTGSLGYEPIYPAVNANGTLLFVDSDGGIWATDGTLAGTQLIDEAWWNVHLAGELTYFSRYPPSRFSSLDPELEPWVLRNYSALVDLNGSVAGKSYSTIWRGTPVAIADPDATIETSARAITGLNVTLWPVVPGSTIQAVVAGTDILADFDGTTLRLSGADTRENYQQVLRSIRFHATGLATQIAELAVDIQAFTDEGYAVVPVRTTIKLSPQVISRHLFYNDSAFDGGDAGANAADDGAIAPDKIAHRPGMGLATTASVSSYVHGINGLMIDVAGLQGELTADDFIFRVGTSNSPESWALAPAPLEVVVRAGQGAGGSDRVTITWAGGAIKNTWLEVTVKGNDAAGGFNTNTGLAESDVFYFGSRVGDTFEGATALATATNARDELAARFAPGIAQAIESIWDFNRDGVVNAADQLIARHNAGVLLMIDVDALAEELTAHQQASVSGVGNSGADLGQSALAFALALDDDDAHGEEFTHDAWRGRKR